ncbi:MAG TPA: nucleotidyltransferase family protein [Chloroflexota bacterium]|nr:nucleotidyltransferase family protein [Chloroflexota bacterium]
MNTFRREARLIALCTREADAAGASGIAAAAGAVRSWEAVVELSDRHRVAAHVHAALRRAGAGVPEAAAGALRRAALRRSAAVFGLERTLRRVLDALGAAGVPVIVLKGPVLARTIYPEPGLRPYSDVDLTVQEAHVPAAVAALQACGLSEIVYQAEAARQTHAGHVEGGASFHRMFVEGPEGALVELHAEPLQLGLRPTGEAGRWARAVAVEGLPGALMLGLDDQAVQLSVHAHKHGFERLIWLKDLDRLIRARGAALDWERIAAVAGEEGVRPSVWYAFHLAGAILGAPLPAGTLAPLRPPAPVRALYRLTWPVGRIAALDGRMRRRAVQFHSAESWRGMLPSLIYMGRRGDRVRAIGQALRRRAQ